MNKEGGGKFIKEMSKKTGSYTYKYSPKETKIENRLHLISQKLKHEYNSIDFKNDKYAGVKLQAVYNEIIGNEIDKAKKEKNNLKSEKRIKEATEILKALKERYPIEYENYTIKIKNKVKSKLRRSKSFFKRQFTL